jgi:DNA invertase Pin-like site-specific DNA recombinase
MKGAPHEHWLCGSSTIDQEAGYQAQLKALGAAGCDKVFAEKVSSVAQRANACRHEARQACQERCSPCRDR